MQICYRAHPISRWHMLWARHNALIYILIAMRARQTKSTQCHVSSETFVPERTHAVFGKNRKDSQCKHQCRRTDLCEEVLNGLTLLEICSLCHTHISSVMESLTQVELSSLFTSALDGPCFLLPKRNLSALHSKNINCKFVGCLHYRVQNEWIQFRAEVESILWQCMKSWACRFCHVGLD